MMSRALPLLLLFVTFLFINAEVWQVTSRQDGGELWLVVLLFSVLAVAFLLVRLPEEVDRTDDHVDDAFLLDACRGTPLEQVSRDLVDDPDCDPAAYAEVKGYEFGNLVMVLVVIQVVQVLLLAVTVFAFFLVFGGLVMTNDVVEAWIGESSHAWRYLPNLTVELVQVSIFLAAFSGPLPDRLDRHRRDLPGAVLRPRAAPDGACGRGPGGLPRAARAGRRSSDPASA